MSILRPYHEMLVAEWARLGRPNLWALAETQKRKSVQPGVFVATPKIFSQDGEDLILRAMFSAFYGPDCDWSSFRYVDVGANHPFNMSNTWAFYLLGASGVLVEPNSKLCVELQRQRPNDTVLNCGIRFSEDTTLTYYETSKCEVSGFDHDFLSKFVEEKGGAERGWEFTDSYPVDLMELESVFEQLDSERPPDLLSIDTEGSDLAILKRLDLENHRPHMIVIEPSDSIVSDDRGSGAIVAHLKSCDYAAVARTLVNLIFQDRRRA